MLDKHPIYKKQKGLADVLTESFDTNDIEYLHLAPNTTSICQPVDVEIGAVIKGKIKTFFEEWVVDSWETDDFVKYNAKKNKYTYKAPSKALVIEWIQKAYEETSKQTILNGFRKAGVTDREQQSVIINEKLQDLCIVHEIEEFVHLEKDLPDNKLTPTSLHICSNVNILLNFTF